MILMTSMSYFILRKKSVLNVYEILKKRIDMKIEICRIKDKIEKMSKYIQDTDDIPIVEIEQVQQELNNLLYRIKNEKILSKLEKYNLCYLRF